MTFPIEEGEQYHLGKFTIRGTKIFKEEPLKQGLRMKPGDVFDITKVRKAIENYTKLYGNYGYINFTAEPDIEPDRKKKVINLALDFTEDKQFFVHRIEFAGNTKTRDKVVRRELLVDEGHIFSSGLWDLSVMRVNQLGFFDQIKKEDYDIKQNRADSTVDINIKVKEKGRNSIGFSGGVSGLAGNFVGANYSTNNFLGLGETLSLAFQWGTFQKMYSFGFTEPYLYDKPITTGFTIFKSDYKYDQAQITAAYSGINPQVLKSNPFATALYQNFEQNSSGFTVFASYPLHRHSFTRVGVTYSFSNSSMQAFSQASQAYFEALNFQGLAGPNALSGITSSQIMPTILYNSVDDAWNPHTGKYIYLGLGFSGSVLGGKVNTIQPTFEFKYFHPINHRRNTLGFHLVASSVAGYGGLVAPPFSRFYIGGEYDLRGFDIRSISPVVFYPTIGSVCNRDNNGNMIQATDGSGHATGGCGSSTQFPYNTPLFPGGDTELVTNSEYRIPIAGPVTLSYFVHFGGAFITRTSQLQLTTDALSSISTRFPYFPIPKQLRPIAASNYRPHASTGLELQVILPIVNAPIRVFYGYNFLRENDVVNPPQDLPPESIFPNHATYVDALTFFKPFLLKERSGRLGFTVARTF